MVVNHFPIIGTIFGLGILITGIVLKNKTVKTVAYVLFIIAALFGAFSMGTGEGAEELVEDMPSVGKQIIHEHEELAETFALLLYIIGTFSILSMYFLIKKIVFEKYTSLLVVVLALVAVFFAKQVGTSGGEIRHTEIRANATAVGEVQSPSGAEQGEKEGDD
jgi:uncharacterized membrane protein